MTAQEIHNLIQERHRIDQLLQGYATQLGAGRAGEGGGNERSGFSLEQEVIQEEDVNWWQTQEEQAQEEWQEEEADSESSLPSTARLSPIRPPGLTGQLPQAVVQSQTNVQQGSVGSTSSASSFQPQYAHIPQMPVSTSSSSSSRSLLCIGFRYW